MPASPTTRSGSTPRDNHLFGILTRTDDHTMAELPDTEIMKRWWKHMADIMETDARQRAGAGAAQAGVLPAMSTAFRIKDLRVYTLAQTAQGGDLFQARRQRATGWSTA